MGKAPCCDKANVKKVPWYPAEDAKLKEYIEKHGTGGNWIALPQKVGLKRSGKSCRLRWLNYLRPNIKHGEFSEAEDRVICSLFASIGSRWSVIASQLPGRTDNDIKNYWNTKLKKKMIGMKPQQVTFNQYFKIQHHIHHYHSETATTYTTILVGLISVSESFSYPTSFVNRNSSSANSVFQAQKSFKDPSQNSKLKDSSSIFMFGLQFF